MRNQITGVYFTGLKPQNVVALKDIKRLHTLGIEDIELTAGELRVLQLVLKPDLLPGLKRLTLIEIGVNEKRILGLAEPFEAQEGFKVFIFSEPDQRNRGISIADLRTRVEPAPPDQYFQLLLPAR